MDRSVISEIVCRALSEDIGDGDMTSAAVVDPETILRGRIIVKEGGIIAGLDVARTTHATVDERIRMNLQVRDGEKVVGGQVVTTVEGPGLGVHVICLRGSRRPSSLPFALVGKQRCLS